MPEVLEHPRTSRSDSADDVEAHVRHDGLAVDDGDAGGDDDHGDDDDHGGGGDDGDGDGDDDSNDTPWVTVATFWTPVDAQMARLRLEGEGIRVVVLDENLIATDWLFANAVGGIKLMVPGPAAALARALLVRHAAAAAGPSEGQPVPAGRAPCPQCGSAELGPASRPDRPSALALFVRSLLLRLAPDRRGRSRCAACGREWA